MTKVTIIQDNRLPLSSYDKHQLYSNVFDFSESSKAWRHNKFRNVKDRTNKIFKYCCNYENKKCNAPPHNSNRNYYSKVDHELQPFYRIECGLCCSHLKLSKWGLNLSKWGLNLSKWGLTPLD